MSKEKKCIPSFDDIIVIINVCKERIIELRKINKYRSRKEIRTITKSLRHLLDYFSLPDGVTQGVIESLKKIKKDKTMKR